MVTASLPTIALYHSKVRTVTSKCPAVVQRPDNPDIVLLDVMEQHGKVLTEAMQIMQVNDVWLKFFQCPNQLLRSQLGKTSIQSEECSAVMMDPILPEAPEFHVSFRHRQMLSSKF